MSHKKIWLAIREMEDQQARDYKRTWGAIKRLTEAADLNVVLGKKVWGRLDELHNFFDKTKGVHRSIDTLTRQGHKRWAEIDALAERVEPREVQPKRCVDHGLVGYKAGSFPPEVKIRMRSKLSLQAEIDKLADYILAEIPREPGMDEGAVDTAIRLMGRYREALRKIEEKSGSSTPAQYRDVVETYRIARNALKGEGDE